MQLELWQKIWKNILWTYEDWIVVLNVFEVELGGVLELELEMVIISIWTESRRDVLFLYFC